MRRSLSAVVIMLLLAQPCISQEKPEDNFKVEPGRTAEDYYNIGNWYFEREQHYKAIAYYKAAIAQNQSFAEAWNNLGAAYSEVERFDESVEAYRKAVELASTENFVYLNLGNALTKTGKLRDAALAYRTFIQLEPYDPDGYKNLGITLFRLKDYEQAADAFEKLLLIEKDDSYFTFQTARCYAILGRYDKTLEKIQAALILDPDIGSILEDDPDFRGFRRSEQYRQLKKNIP